MSSEMELGPLKMTIEGDQEPYAKSLKSAQNLTTSFAQAVKAETERIFSYLEAQAENVKSLFSNIAKLAASIGISSFLKSSSREWDSASEAIIRLEATLRANGREVEKLSKDYRNWGSEIQSVTRLGDEQAFLLLKTAETYQLTGDAAKQAAKDAISLSAVTGMSAEALMRITTAMAKNDRERAMAFSRMIPQLRGVKDETEFIARYQKLVQSGWEVELQLTNKMSGQLTQIYNIWGDIKEQIGKVVEDAISPLLSHVKTLVSWLYNLPQSYKVVLTYSGMILAALAALPIVMSSVSSFWGAMKNMIINATIAVISFGKSLVVFVFSPIFLMAAGIVMVLEGLTGVISKVVSGLVDGFKQAKKSVDAFIYAVSIHDFETAWNLIKVSARTAFLVMTKDIRENWAGTVGVITYWWNEGVGIIKRAWEKFTYGLQQGWNYIVTSIANVWYDLLYDLETRIITGKYRLGIIDWEEGQRQINALNDEYRNFHNKRNQEMAERAIKEAMEHNRRMQEIDKEVDERQLKAKEAWEKDLSTIRQQVADSKAEQEKLIEELNRKREEAAKQEKKDERRFGGSKIDDAPKPTKAASTETIQAVLAFSAEAMSRVMAYKSGIGAEKPMQKEQLEEAKETNELLASIKSTLETSRELSLGLA